MIEQKIQVSARGDVQAYLIDKAGNKLPLFEKKNAILTNAKTILAKCIAGVNNHLDYIVAYKLGAILFAAPIPSGTITYPAANSVQFVATFGLADFNDTLDELRLNSSFGGDFSQITALQITKDSLHQLMIVWKITFEDCVIVSSPGDFNPDFNQDFS